MQKKGVAVVAVGGNALIKDKDHETIQDQFIAASDTTAHIADMILAGWDVVITHGNGPQVGFNLRRSELAKDEVFEVPLDYCGADTQGSIGYMFAQALHNEFRRQILLLYIDQNLDQERIHEYQVQFLLQDEKVLVPYLPVSLQHRDEPLLFCVKPSATL